MVHPRFTSREHAQPLFLAAGVVSQSLMGGGNLQRYLQPIPYPLMVRQHKLGVREVTEQFRQAFGGSYDD